MVSPMYRTQPIHTMPDFTVGEGYEALAARVREHIAAAGPRPLIVIDGFVGTQWSAFIGRLRAALDGAGVAACWRSTADCFLPASRIDALLAPVLTDDPVFGRLYHGRLEEWWDAERVEALRRTALDRTTWTFPKTVVRSSPRGEPS